jgi:hypothetical protein
VRDWIARPPYTRSAADAEPSEANLDTRERDVILLALELGEFSASLREYGKTRSFPVSDGRG